MTDLNYFLFDDAFYLNNEPIDKYIPDRSPMPDVTQPEVDPGNPLKLMHTGFFTGQACDGKGKERKYGFYVPETMEHSGNLIFVFCDGGQTAKEAFERADWGRMLEERKATAVFIASDREWNREKPGEELDYILRVYMEVTAGIYFVPTACAYYVLGLGSGAFIASIFSVLFGGTIAAFAVSGVSGFTEELAQRLSSLPVTGRAGATMAERPLAAWINDGSADGERLLDFMKCANHCSQKSYLQDDVEIWLPEQRFIRPSMRGPAQGQVRYGGLPKDDGIARMLDFVLQFRRQGSFLGDEISYFHDIDDIPLQQVELNVDGRKRQFYIYVPSSYEEKADRNYPLVFASHGFSCTGPFFADNCGWPAVAEERGVIAVFPTGYARLNSRMRDRGSYKRCPTPCWNCYITDETGETPDDIAFFQAMIDYMKMNYRVDSARIYATGHSNGGAMTQDLMERLPKEFAAFASVGSVADYRDKHHGMQMLDDHILRPVRYFMGEFDLGEGWSLEEGGINMTALEMLCACNHVDLSSAAIYCNGVYRNLTVMDSDGVPMVTFTGVEGMPHTYTPEIARIVWDEFFCKFSRDEDGTARYMGRPVKKNDG